MAGNVNPTVEIKVNGVWTDISGDVYYRDSIDISRGRANEGSTSDTSIMTLTLDNRTGNYSPRNPRGAYFGQIGRNTKIRASVKMGQVRQRNVGNDYFSAPDSVPLSITSDIDLRVDVWLSTWRPANSSYIGLRKDGAYSIYIQPDGTLVMSWYSGAAFNSIASTVPIPGGTVGRKSVRATLDVVNGANKTATFYYSNDQTMSGTWVQFDTVTTAGNTSIDDSTNNLITYMQVDVSPSEINQIQVYQGIAGTLRANPIFTAQASGTTSFSDSAGNTWTNAGGSFIDNKYYRFWGDVSVWPIKWDTSGADRYAMITCSGLMRRIGQGNAPLQSSLRRAIPSSGAALVGYWPLEDASGTTTPEAYVTGTIAPKYIGAVEPGKYTAFVSSEKAPTLNGGRIWMPVKPYTNTDFFQVRFILRISSTTIPNNTTLFRIYTNNSLGRIDWIYQTGDVMYFKTYNNLDVLSLTSTGLDITNEIAGQDCFVSLSFKKNGGNVDVTQVIMPIGEKIGFFVTDSNVGVTLGSATTVYINPDGVALGDVSVGHVRVENVETDFFSLNLQTAAFRGETACSRIYRLCGEASISPIVAGVGGLSEYLGYQTRTELLSLLQEAATVDGGILHEAVSVEGLRYRSRESLQNQDPAFTVSYAAEGLAQFEPVDDDQRTRNKVTVTRTGGSTSTVEDKTSSLSTQAPPAGAGIYDASASMSLYSDDQATHQAGWLVNLGTVDEARFPTIGLNLAHPDYTSDSVLTRQILLANVGDRIVVTNPPTWLPPEQVDQIVQGEKELITQFEHRLTLNCAPARPYRVAKQNDTPGFTARYSNLSTTLAGTMTTGATSVSVTHTSGPEWTIVDGSYDSMVNGERMTVTNVAGSGTQTFTVTRSVNGIIKTHAIGEAVKLFDPVVYGVTGKSGQSGAYLPGIDVNVPDPVYEYGNGINSIVATSPSPLPTTKLNAYITNPHPTRDMIAIVCYGGWGSAVTTGFRVSTYVNRGGSQFTNTGPDSNGPLGWGEIPYIGPGSSTASYHAQYTTILPPSQFPYVVIQEAWRDAASGTQDWRYPILRIIPLGYV